MYRSTIPLIATYLVAIVVANLAVALFGAGVVLINALLLVALDLTARDRLHGAWHGRHLRRNMALLIASGSLLSAALDYRALPVAVASCCAFATAGLADTIVYARPEDRRWLIRANGSNLVSAALDSAVFLSLLAAFGVLPWESVPLLVLGQWLAKAAGGVLWSIVLKRGA